MSSTIESAKTTAVLEYNLLRMKLVSSLRRRHNGVRHHTDQKAVKGNNHEVAKNFLGKCTCMWPLYVLPHRILT